MDTDTLNVASRLTAAMLPQVELDQNGEAAVAQVASLYWAIVNQLVQQRKQKTGPAVPTLRT